MDNALISELLNLSLYAPIELTEDQMDEYNSLNSNTVRSYCPFCNETSIFRILKRAYFSGHETIQYIKDEPEPNVDSALTLVNARSNRFVCKDVSNVIILSCNLDISHQIALFFQIVNNSIIKVGQYPSFIDLQRDKKDSISSYQTRIQKKYIGNWTLLTWHWRWVICLSQKSI